MDSGQKWTEIGNLAEDSLQPKLDKILEESEGDFEVKNSEVNLNKILGILQEINPNSDILELNVNVHLSKALILIGEHLGGNGSENPRWSTEVTRELSRQVLQEILNLSERETLTALFTKDFETHTERKSLFGRILGELKPKLRKGDECDQMWRRFPAAQLSFCWILKFIQYPNLSPFLDSILPPTLLFIDDYNDCNILLGLKCLSHILDNVNATDLRNFNRAKVIYSGLKHHINSKNPTVIDSFIPILLRILSTIEKDPNQNASTFTEYDEAMKSILFAVEFGTSDNVQLRTSWLTHLTSILPVLGLATLHWNDKLLRILLDFSLNNDPRIWIQILNCLDLLIQNAWPNPDSESILEILLRILFNASVFQMNSEELSRKITQSFDKLNKITNGKDRVNEIIEKNNGKSELNAKLHPLFIQALQELITT